MAKVKENGQVFHPRSELGRRLWELRQAVLASGAERLDWNDLERELAERRGGGLDSPTF